MSARDERYPPIGDHALIGDCHGTALVRKDGVMDWACLRRFDSGAVFSAILDADRGGQFRIAPAVAHRSSRKYLSRTNVLETTFTSRGGEARLIDCFAMREGGREAPLQQLIRVVEGVRGIVPVEIFIQPRFDYASVHPRLRDHAAERLHSAAGAGDAVVLSAGCDLQIDEEAVAWRGHFTVEPGQRVRFSFSAANPFDLDLRRPSPAEIDARLDATITWWRRWVERGQLSAGEEVIRSALLLQLLTCAPTGAMVAAPTTSLPERVGGERNWDYRYCWIRDATMTLSALFAAGHPEVATRFKRFIESATAGRPDELQIMYGCYGERRLTELSIQSLEGYRGSRPVRAGNAAAGQSQLDVYGELLDAANLWRQAEGPIAGEDWRFLRGVVDAACRRWKEPDQGMWEMRGEPRHFVFSKAMCWLAVERGLSFAERDHLPCDFARWRAARDEIRRSIEKHGIDRERNCFVQAYGGRDLDASLLRLPLIGFIGAEDPVMQATTAAIRRDLGVGPLLRRYRPKSGDGEGAFLMASFWLVDVLAMSGRFAEAEALYRELLSLRNDVGLYAEECDPDTREPLGNFPQALTHVAMITAAEHLRRVRGTGGRQGALSNRPIGPFGSARAATTGVTKGRT